MTTLNVVGFANSTKLPGTYLSLILGGPGTSAGAAPIKQLHLGNMIGSAITLASPSMTTVPAGTASLNVAYPVTSAAQSSALFGAGSELHLQATSAFAVDPNATLYQCATAQGTGQATGVITFTGSQTGAVTCRVVVCGRFVDVPIAAGDSLSTIGAAVATAICQQTSWPVTAQNSAGVVTISAKHVGSRGNNLTFRCILIAGANSVKATAGALAATMLGLTATLSGGTAVTGVYRLSGGSTEEALTTALAALASARYHRYVPAQQGSTALSAIVAQLNTMASPSIQMHQQCIAGSVDTAANVNSLTLTENAPLLQVAWHRNSDWTPGEIAAAVAAARVAGDSALGGSLVGEASDPAANLDGVLLPIPAQDVLSDQPSVIELEAALNHGVTPLQVLPTGLTAVARSITTRFNDAQGNPDFGVIDTSSVTVTQYEADLLRADHAKTFAGTKLGPDAPGGAASKIPNMVSPSIVRARLMYKLKDEESQGHIISVDDHASSLTVIADPNTPGRTLGEIPIVPAPSYHQLAANVRQLSF